MKTFARYSNNVNNTKISSIIRPLIMLFLITFMSLFISSNVLAGPVHIGPGGSTVQDPIVRGTVYGASANTGDVKVESGTIYRKLGQNNSVRFGLRSYQQGGFSFDDGSGGQAINFSGSIYINGSSYSIPSISGNGDVYVYFNYSSVGSVTTSNGTTARINIPGSVNTTIKVSGTFSANRAMSDTDNSGEYVIKEYIQDNQAPIFNGFDILNKNPSKYGTYLEGVNAQLQVAYKEPNYSSYSITLDGNSASCDSPGFSSTGTSYYSYTFNCNIGSVPIDYNRDHTFKVTINDQYGNSSSETVSFRKIGRDYLLNITDFRIRAKAASVDNLIGPNHNGEITIYYSVSNESMVDTSYTKLSIGGNFYSNSGYISSGSVVTRPETWDDNVSNGTNLSSYIELKNSYGQLSRRNIDVKYDSASPSISSVNVSLTSDGASYSWVNSRYLYFAINASDSSGIDTYSLDQITPDTYDERYVRDSRDAQSLRRNGYICLLDADGIGQRCSKNIPGGEHRIAWGETSHIFSAQVKTASEDELFNFKGCAVDKAGNIGCRQNNSVGYDVTSPSVNSIYTNTGWVFRDVRYTRDNIIDVTLSYSESRLDTSYLVCYYDSNSVPCSHYSGTFSSGNNSMVVRVDTSSQPASFDNSINLQVQIRDTAHNINGQYVYFKKIDNSRNINISSFSIRADAAHVDNLIGSNSIGRMDFNYSISDTTYLDNSFTKISVGGSNINSSGYVFANGNNYINSGTSLSLGQAWLDKFSNNNTATARIQFRNIYGIVSESTRTVYFDFTGPSISSVNLVDLNGFYNGWTNQDRFTMTINASDTNGVYNYEAYQYLNGSEEIYVRDSREAQALRQNGYYCRIADPDGGQICSKPTGTGYEYMTSSTSNQLSLVATNIASYTKYKFRGYAYDNAGNSSYKDNNDLEFDNVSPNITSNTTDSGWVFNDVRYVENNLVYVDVSYKEDYLDTGFLICYVEGNSVPCSHYSGTFSSGTNTMRIKVDITSVPVNFDNQVLLQVQIRDLAHNINGHYVNFARIDRSRIISINSLSIRSRTSYLDNLLGKNSKGYVTFKYSLASSTYLDETFAKASIGGNNINSDGYVFSSGTYFTNGSELHIDESWTTNFSDGETIYARAQFRNIYGQYSTREQAVTIDYTNPTINNFKVRKNRNEVDNIWTNTLTNQVISSASDTHGINKYVLKQYGKDDIKDVSNGNDAQALRHNGYACYLFDNQGTYRCVRNDPSQINESTSSNFTANSLSIGQGDIFRYVLVVTDMAGNISDMSDETLKYDTQAPTINDISLTGGNYISSITRRFTNQSTIGGNYDVYDYDSGLRSVEIIDKVDQSQISKSTHNFGFDTRYPNGTFTLETKNNNNIHSIYVNMEDYAGNTATGVFVDSYTFDNIAPTYKHEVVDNQVKSYIDYTFTKVNDNDDNTAPILTNNIDYFFSVIDVTYQQIQEHWLKEELDKASAIELPSRPTNLYLNLKYDQIKDYAGNSLLSSDAHKTFTSEELYSVAKGISASNNMISSNHLVSLLSTREEADKIIFFDETIVWFIDSVTNPQINIDDLSFLGFDKVLANSGFRVHNISNLTVNSTSSGTYAYDDIFVSDLTHKFNIIVDLIILVQTPIILNNTSASVVNVNQGEEYSNRPVTFISPVGENVTTNTIISLDGEKVDKVDTNIPGTYSIRTRAIDNSGRVSYLDKTVVVNKAEKVKEVETLQIKEEKEIKKVEELKEVTRKVKEVLEPTRKVESKLVVAKIDGISKINKLKGGKESLLERLSNLTTKIFSRLF